MPPAPRGDDVSDSSEKKFRQNLDTFSPSLYPLQVPSPPHHPPGVPPISFHARALGTIEFVCPHCFRFQHVLTVNWRKPRWRCTNRHCNRLISFGIHAGLQLIRQPPWGALLVTDSGEEVTVNSLGGAPVGSARAIGQVVGPMEWWCPDCATRNLGKPLPGVGQVTCTRCRTPIFVSLVLRQPTPGAHARTPADWIPPMEYTK